jgi:8-oxo-dGTP pyrophosphatase MutT (NUDIX family)
VEIEGVAASAVLVPLFSDADGMHVVLTRRSWGLRTHRGEVSFPGGRCDPGETAAEAALREAWEEVALDPDSVEVLGELDHLTTVTRRAFIVPVLGLMQERPLLRANPEEVDEALLVPLDELMSPGVFREERWGSEELHRPVYFFDLVGDTVWGATAAMLRQLLALLTGTDPGGAEDRDPAGGLTRAFRLDYPDPDGVV